MFGCFVFDSCYWCVRLVVYCCSLGWFGFLLSFDYLLLQLFWGCLVGVVRLFVCLSVGVVGGLRVWVGLVRFVVLF